MFRKHPMSLDYIISRSRALCSGLLAWLYLLRCAALSLSNTARAIPLFLTSVSWRMLLPICFLLRLGWRSRIINDC
ncbi:hypothetical protein C2E23DRAFT_342427 [Lenzites betulinus]|nr:hypothetical protein C2E23DRAFT_342427 [Lenzites betulinus]